MNDAAEKEKMLDVIVLGTVLGVAQGWDLVDEQLYIFHHFIPSPKFTALQPCVGFGVDLVTGQASIIGPTGDEVKRVKLELGSITEVQTSQPKE